MLHCIHNFLSTVYCFNIHVENYQKIMSHNTGATVSNIFLKEVPSPAREGVIPHQGPLHPQLVSEAARLATYQDWPPGLRQKKEEMAGAGLFYVGQSDQVSLPQSHWSGKIQPALLCHKQPARTSKHTTDL